MAEALDELPELLFGALLLDEVKHNVPPYSTLIKLYGNLTRAEHGHNAVDDGTLHVDDVLRVLVRVDGDLGVAYLSDQVASAGVLNAHQVCHSTYDGTVLHLDILHKLFQAL